MSVSSTDMRELPCSARRHVPYVGREHVHWLPRFTNLTLLADRRYGCQRPVCGRSDARYPLLRLVFRHRSRRIVAPLPAPPFAQPHIVTAYLLSLICPRLS